MTAAFASSFTAVTFFSFPRKIPLFCYFPPASCKFFDAEYALLPFDLVEYGTHFWVVNNSYKESLLKIFYLVSAEDTGNHIIYDLVIEELLLKLLSYSDHNLNALTFSHKEPGNATHLIFLIWRCNQ